MQKRNNSVLILIAYGSEDMEVAITADILRRAGLSVTIAGESQIVTCSRGLKIIPDAQIDDILEEDIFDAVVLPGGSRGVESLADNPQVERLIRINFERGALICAICAAPSLLARFGLLQDLPDMEITSHPSVAAILRQTTPVQYVERDVVQNGNIITARGAGTSVEFALAMVQFLESEQKARKIAGDIIFSRFTALPARESTDKHLSDKNDEQYSDIRQRLQE